jgi:hypothetical protein
MARALALRTRLANLARQSVEITLFRRTALGTEARFWHKAWEPGD